MPELPEVETIVRDLESAPLPGARIERVRVSWPRTIAEPSPRVFASRIKDRTIRDVSRRGKYIRISLSGDHDLLIHLRMTGALFLTDTHTARSVHEHVVLFLDGGRELRFRDTRKFGRWWLVRDPETVLGRLGPEPLAPDFTRAVFERGLAGKRRMLKPLLLDQHVIAGLGNIYVDEALWDAGLHPCRSYVSLSEDERRKLYASIRRVLRRGIRCLGASLGNGHGNFASAGGRRGAFQDAFRVFQRTGQPCPRCGGEIDRLIVGQRSTHICVACQAPPRGA